MPSEAVQGAARQSWKTDSPRALLRDILDAAKDPYRRNGVFETFAERVMEQDKDSKLFANIIEYWFDNNYRSAVRKYPEEEKSAKADRAKREVAAKRAAIDLVINRKADEKTVLLLATMMPIGKAFGDCTGSELRSMREHLPKTLDAVIAKVGDNVLARSVLTDKQLGKLALRLV
jgi:hypothetical protein